MRIGEWGICAYCHENHVISGFARIEGDSFPFCWECQGNQTRTQRALRHKMSIRRRERLEHQPQPFKGRSIGIGEQPAVRAFLKHLKGLPDDFMV